MRRITLLTLGTAGAIAFGLLGGSVCAAVNQAGAPPQEVIIHTVEGPEITDTSLAKKQAAQTVKDLLDAWNKEQWDKVDTLLYNTLPVAPPHGEITWNLRKASASYFKPFTYELVKEPYIMGTWKTPVRGFLMHGPKGDGEYDQSVFTNVVVVPVVYNNLTMPLAQRR